jgi:hypothetical protein
VLPLLPVVPGAALLVSAPVLEPVLPAPGVLVLVSLEPMPVVPAAPEPAVPPMAELSVVGVSPVISGPAVGELGPPVLVFVLDVGPAGAVLRLSSRPQAETASASATAAATYKCLGIKSSS